MPIAAVTMVAYQKIGEGITLLDEYIGEEIEQLNEHPEVNPVPANAKPVSPAARSKRSGK